MAAAEEILAIKFSVLGDQPEVFVDGFIDRYVSALVLAFTAQTVGGPGDDEPTGRVTKTDRTLSSTVPESLRRSMAAKSVDNGFVAACSRIDDDPQPKVDRVAQSFVEAADAMSRSHF